MSNASTDLRRNFASDNNAGMCPEVAAALERCNGGHVSGYGNDVYTERARALIRETFETDCEVFLVFNGTAANALAISALGRSIDSVLCHAYSHIYTDECNAPGYFAHGVTLRSLHGAQGKLDAQSLIAACLERTDVHAPRPGVLSLTQATELGTTYSQDELHALCEVARQHKLRVHMDGARFANAVAAAGLLPADLSWRAGVDVLCLGGTKNGMALGEAVVFFDKDLAREFAWRCKQAGQLASKMRFLAAQWIGLLENGVWLRNADHANQLASQLEQRLRQLPWLQLKYPRQSNAVFIDLPQPIIDRMHAKGWRFYNDVGPPAARLMCAWDTNAHDVEAFVADLSSLAPSRTS